ncbi:hypothetical protein P3T43_000874 [Paraburkholderia sp. GAS41]
MRVVRWSFAALISFCGTVPSSAFALNGPQTQVFPLSVIDNRPFIAVNVDAKGPFSFILDTGSSSTTVSATLATRLKLAIKQDGTGTGAGEQPLAFKIVHLNDLSVGHFSIGALDTPAMDTAELSRVIGFQHFDGVLGAELFRKYIVTLDPAREELTLQQPNQFKPMADAIPIDFSLDENEMPVVKASVGGTTGMFQIDTGDRFSLTLFDAFWRAHQLDRHMGTTVAAMTGYGGGGPIRGIVGRATPFSIGNLPVPAPVTRLSLQKAGAFTRTDRAGSIGMGILKRFKVSFDYGRHVMWLSKGPGFEAPDLYDRSGMWLGLSQQRGLRVIDVTPNGPAAKAGIHTGDVILKVGSVRADFVSLFRIRAMLQQPHTSAIPILVNHTSSVQQTRLVLQDLISP